MSQVVVNADAVEVFNSDPNLLAVGFLCRSLGPFCYVGLERACRPAAGDRCYSAVEVSLDLDLRPLANMGCTPGVVRAVEVSRGRITLELRDGLDPELGNLRVISIEYGIDEALDERLRSVLQVMFDGTSTALNMQDAEPSSTPFPT